MNESFFSGFYKVIRIVSRFEQLQHHARAIKLIQNQLETKPNSIDLEEKLIQLYEKLGWNHCAQFAREGQESIARRAGKKSWEVPSL